MTKTISCFFNGFLGLVLFAIFAGNAHSEMLQVPFGDKVSSVIFNYNRTLPQVATSGRILKGGVSELKAHGFKTILDLRTPGEGTADEKIRVTAQGLSYFNIPIGRAAPTPAQVAKFAQIVESKQGHPILVHCASANRVGAMWALYRVSQGASIKQALREGRTIGMKPSRERQIKSVLGAP